MLVWSKAQHGTAPVSSSELFLLSSLLFSFLLIRFSSSHPTRCQCWRGTLFLIVGHGWTAGITRGRSTWGVADRCRLPPSDGLGEMRKVGAGYGLINLRNDLINVWYCFLFFSDVGNLSGEKEFGDSRQVMSTFHIRRRQIPNSFRFNMGTHDRWLCASWDHQGLTCGVWTLRFSKPRACYSMLKSLERSNLFLKGGRARWGLQHIVWNLRSHGGIGESQPAPQTTSQASRLVSLADLKVVCMRPWFQVDQGIPDRFT